MGDCRIFGWQPKRIPSNRMNDVMLFEAVEVGNGVADVVDAGVAEVQFAARVRELDEAVEFWVGGEVVAEEDGPLMLPF